MMVLQAYEAQFNKTEGVITDLSKRYTVSRPFTYTLLSPFKREMGSLFFPKKQPVSLQKESSERTILAQRFEGKGSIDAMSTLMKRSNRPYSSVGYIREFLSDGGQFLPNTLENKQKKNQRVVFAGDEIFAKSILLLITVERISSALLRIERADQRTAAIWSTHFQAIEANGFKAC